MADTVPKLKSVELSAIINVVQHDLQYAPKSQRKMELKSVVCLGNQGTRKSKGHEVKGHDTKSPSKVSKVSSEKPVLLLPFGHQVSGRASILCYDETTLLKPYVSRELFFYQTISQDLKKFTPQFRGLVTVSFIEDSRTASVLAYALPRTLVKPNTKNMIKVIGEQPKPHSKRCVKDYGKTHVIYPSGKDQLKTSYNTNENDEKLFVESGENFSPMISQIQKNDDVVGELSQGFDVTVCIEDKKVSGKENEFSTTGLHNPWNSKVLDDAWLKLKFSDTDNPSNGKKKRFTLLENAVARYRRPCVLDLKIGTRVRENASPDKIARHVTAINLGARLSGMQIYHPEQEQFTYHNKYYGHNLTVTGFKSNLRHFFSRGVIPIKGSKARQKDKNSSIDKKLVEQAMGKLTELKNTIESVKSHRFYSSSVLLLYEGDNILDGNDEIEKVKVEKDQNEAIIVIADEPPPSEPVHEVVMPNQKLTSRSFSFSEFLQRLKQSHTKHHSKQHSENSSGNHDEFCDSRRKHSSLKHPKTVDAYKREKSRKNGDRRSAHEIDDHPRDLDYYCEQKFDSKSWPPRSKLSRKPHSLKVDREKDRKIHGESSKRHSHKAHETGTARSSRKHHRDVEKGHKAVVTEDDHSQTSLGEGSHDKVVHSRKNGEKSRLKESRSEQHSSKHLREPEREKSPKRGIDGSCEKEVHSHNHHDEYDKSHGDHGKGSRREVLKRRHSDVPIPTNDAIEVKMIDFAHYCFHDNEMHPGADGGFLFGLENLIRLLDDMLKL